MNSPGVQLHERSLPLASSGRIRWLESRGRGRAIAFVHGLGASSEQHFTPLVASSFPARRTLLVDLVGFASSDRPEDFDYSLEGHADAVASVLEAAGSKPVDLVGHSLGGSIAIVLADRRPDLVARLVAIEPNLDPWDGQASVGIARQSEEEFVRRGYADLLATAPPSWASTLRLADPVALHRTAVGLCAPVGRSPRERLADLAIDRSLLWGDRSPAPIGLEELLARGVQYRLVAGSGHVPMEDAPDGFARVLAEVLA